MSGPSGVGKSSVVEGLFDRRPFHFSVSATTRPRRIGERDGVDYHFVDRARFEAMIADGALLEWAEYNGQLYGTPRGPVFDQLESGHDVLLDIENDGARQVKQAYPEALLVFLLPPSMGELERRLRDRGDTTGQDATQRLALAQSQIAEALRDYDHLVVNDDLRAAIDEVVSILPDMEGAEAERERPSP